MLYPLLFIIANLIYFLIIKESKQRGFLNQLHARKFLHIGSSLGAITATYFVTPLQYLIVCLLFAIFYCLLLFNKRLSHIEYTKKLNLGAPLFPLGLALLSLAFWEHQPLHILGILILGLPDPLGAYAQEWAITNKSHHGIKLKTLVVCTTTFLILISQTTPIIAILAATLITTVEHYSPQGTDNFTIPVAFSLTMFALGVI